MSQSRDFTREAKHDGHALNLDETMKSDLASKIEQVLSTGKYNTINPNKTEKVRPKSSYIRGSQDVVDVNRRDKPSYPTFDTAKKTQNSDHEQTAFSSNNLLQQRQSMSKMGKSNMSGSNFNIINNQMEKSKKHFL